MRPRNKNDYNLNDCYKICLPKVVANNANSVAFCNGAIGVPGCDPRNIAKMALATVRLWLESNHTSINHVVFCPYENADYELYRDLMSTV